VRICPSNPFLSAMALVVLALSVTPAPALGADSAKSAAAAPEIKADLVLEGAAVYTVDRVRTWAEAVAVRGDEIVYVGGDKGAARYVGPRTRVVNLRGKMILPGFQDAHVHPLWAGIEKLYCMLYDLSTREAYVRAVAEYAASHPKEQWIRDAIAAFTINAAYVNFHDDRTGSIEPGKLADLVVLDRNLFAIDANQISEAKVLMTLLGGKPVYGDWNDFGD
jgi:predicted amidohydrolase YtcJ